ncbi:MAG: hypothetical protein HYZ22_17915 [Chloroflexi bacterium]|nr:hypothetical protein [Chloroflexota bacterium]
MKPSQLARYLILLISTVLTYFGLGTLMNLGSHPELMGWFAFYSFAMFIEAAVLLLCYFRLNKRSRKIFGLSIILLALNAILVIFDQIGVIDILYVLLNLAALATLYFSRKDFLPE